MLEETAHAPEFAITADDEILLFGREVLPGYIQRNTGGPSVTAHLGRERPIFWLRPGFDGALGQRERFVRDDKVQVEVNRIAESVAARTCPEWIVERKQPRLGFLAADVALLAFEALREPQSLWLFAVARGSLEQNFAGFAVALFHGIDNARPNIRRNRDAVDEHGHRFGEVQIEQRLGGGELEDLSVLIEPVKTALAKLEQALFQQGIVALS